MSARQFNAGAYITTTLANQITSSRHRDSGVVLGLDEGLNNEEHISPLCRRLLAANLMSQSVPLWYQQRVTTRGERFIVQGSSLSPSPLLADVGRAIRGSSWPDEGVVAMMVAHFSTTDRLCLLTQNTKNDRDGLWRIMHEEIRPALESLDYRSLSLLVLAHDTMTTSLASYAALVEDRLVREGVSAGFRWETLRMTEMSLR
jgi:hypothetical protein